MPGKLVVLCQGHRWDEYLFKTENYKGQYLDLTMLMHPFQLRIFYDSVNDENLQ